MKYFLTIFLFVFCSSWLAAQEKHFVYIQSDNNQPFYVSLNGKLLSSTAAGYVIIPKLADGDYNFVIGFAKNEFPEQSFEFIIDQKDLGFVLKNFGEKGWGLFNLQSLNVTMAGSRPPDEVNKVVSEKPAPKDDDSEPFSFNRKKRPVKTKAPSETGANETDAAEKSKDRNSAKGDNTIASAVKKVSETSDDDGVHLSYTEDNGKKTDTIHVTIPSDKTLSNTESTASSSDTSNATSNATSSSNSIASDNSTADKDSLKFLDVNADKSNKDEIKPAKADESVAITNSKCKNIATDDDYARLRKKMAGETTDEKMISEAKKMYRNKCFTTNQIKRLSTLFLSDEGRYNFFNASYNSVADVSEYSVLQSEFIDPAFVNRFKAMLQ